MNTIVYQLVNHFHSAVRWLLLAGLLVSVIMALFSMLSSKQMTPAGRLVSRLTVYCAHTQLLAGVLLYLISPKVIFSAESMSSPILRFYLVEHILAMFISITLITVGHSLMKKAGASPKSAGKIFWFYLVSLILILAMIPWPFLSYGGKWI